MVSDVIVTWGPDRLNWSPAAHPGEHCRDAGFQQRRLRAVATLQFLIDRGIDMTIRDYRWNSTAQGWALYGKNDQKMLSGLKMPNANESRELDEDAR